ncbi:MULTISPECIES: GNAT family N-acetyltransferase [unclassified Pseudomonas]|uniref:GNAT family N-acetyltransferase n=1 Tax=unclassified Pseudomonas TaxID=196821 RepID=UPI000837C139|nr:MULTISPECIES: GNAT family N-acetyltransferase [unclassified Pseudomonas]QIH08995.1 GNAT family N-acetyltransferase [Pseudomonas sp. BIOMIG1BAC]
MTWFSATVQDYWQSQFCCPEGLQGNGGFSVRLNPELEDESRLMLLQTPGGSQAVLAPAMAQIMGLSEAPVATEAEFLARVARAGITFNGADHVFYFPRQCQAELLGDDALGDTRALSASDEQAFTGFQSSASEEDLDNAYVELDHWAVFGAFDEGRLVAAASLYPWDESRLADLGVLTLEPFRGRGHARRLVRAICRHALEQGQEPQYRCQTDNLASVALARAAGLALFGQWWAVSADCEV